MSFSMEIKKALEKLSKDIDEDIKTIQNKKRLLMNGGAMKA